MDRKRNELLLFGAVFLLVLAGCKGGDTTSSSLTTPFLGGEGGVEIWFLEGNPPSEVTDDGTFPFQAIVSVKNVGEHDIDANNLNASLIGFLPSQFKSTVSGEEFAEGDLRKILTTALSGRKKDAEGNVIEPVETFITFPTDTKNFKFSGKLEGNTVFVMRADVCYKYQAKAISELCILQNQIDKASDAICNPTEPKTIFSSGSPIKITSFRENVAGKDKIQFSFDVMHSNAGKVFDPTPDGCPKDPTNIRANEDKVNVTVDTGLSRKDYDLSCVGMTKVAGSKTTNQTGNFKLINGKRTMTCTLDLPATRTDFKKPIDITVYFNYGQTADKEVLVKHLVS